MIDVPEMISPWGYAAIKILAKLIHWIRYHRWL